MEKHLEFIQNIITRHNSNSFMLKGWSVTIASALFALSGTVKLPYISLIAIAPILLFWGLDALYLANERSLVDLYGAVAKNGYKIPVKSLFKKNKDKEDVEFKEGTIDSFDMNFKKFKIWKNNRWFWVLWSKTIFWFYFPMLIITITITIFLGSFLKDSNGAIDINANLKSNEFKIEITKQPDLKVEVKDTINITKK